MFGGPCTVWLGLAAVALVAPERLEEADGDQATGVRQGGVAGLIPLRVVFAADDMEEIAAREAQLLGVLADIIVKRPNDLFQIQSVSVFAGASG